MVTPEKNTRKRHDLVYDIRSKKKKKDMLVI